MSTLSDLPTEERPRERLINYGVEALSLQELLAIVLGRGVKNSSVMVISQKLLSKFGSLQTLKETSIEDLMTVKGLGLAKACQIIACFEISRRLSNKYINTTTSNSNKKIIDEVGPKKIYLAVRSKIVNYHKEHLIIVSLDNRGKIISVDTISVGTLNSNLVHPREVFEVSIKRHAAQIVLCHNHPSNALIPSDDDIKVTKELIAAGNILGIEIVDHLIITNSGFFSFKQKKLI